MENRDKNTLQFLESLRYIAQQGLHYATGDAHDQKRYEQLLTMASEAYGIVLKAPAEAIQKEFLRERGHITPKVGVNGALINPAGQLFLIKRRDDACWSLPCGWCDVNETPQQALAREFQEEVGLHIQVRDLINIFTRLPGDYQALHTSYHIVYLCELPTVLPTDSSTGLPSELRLEPSEVIEACWVDLNSHADIAWHREHEAFARAALKHWEQKPSATSSKGNLSS